MNQETKKRLEFLKRKLKKARKEVEEQEYEEGYLTDDYSILFPYLEVAEIKGRIKELKRR